MKKIFSYKKLFLFVVTIVLCIALTLLSLTVGNQNSVASAGTDSVSWINRILYAPANLINGFSESIGKLMNTYQENEVLRGNMSNLFSLQVRNEELEKENADLKKELQLKANLTDYEAISATVISRSPDLWFNQLVVNVGQDRQIELGMLVMANGGVVGRVSEVSGTSAKVELLTTTKENSLSVSAMIQANDLITYGVISRYDATNKRYIMTNIDLKANVKEGQSVVTSGLTGITPSSLPIGSIESITTDHTGLFKQAVVKPYGEIQDIKYVTIIKRGSERVSN